MRPRTFLVLCGLLCASPGCSFLFDGSEFVGSGTDGGVDGGGTENAPSAPTVTITPDAPVTTDDLAAVITVESVDPLSETVTYEYEWLLDDVAAGVTTASVASTQTTKGQVWTVRVTPVAGTRRGPPGEASVTILNSPPTIRTLGLSTYQPRVDERVRAFAYGVEDADGDATTFSYTWSNGATATSIRSDTIDLGDQGFAADDELNVSVVANDGDEDGPPISIGPIVVDAAVTAWRQLLPNRVTDSESLAFSIFDENHNRVIYFAEDTLFEYALDEGRERWVRLPYSGTVPLLFAPATVYDRANARVLVVGGISETGTNDTTYVLDLSVRGSESWSPLVVGGDDPGPRFWPATIVDEERNRLLVFGTVPFEGVIASNDELWALDLTVGAETWSLIDTGPDRPGPVVGGTWVIDEANDIGYMIGGLLWDDDIGGPIGGGDQVWSLTLTPGEETFSLLSISVPTPIAFPGADWDPTRGHAVIIHGGSNLTLESIVEEVLVFEPGSGFSTFAASDDRIPAGFLEQLVYDEYGDRFISLGGIYRGERFASVATIDAESGAATPLDVPWLTGPGAVMWAQMTQERDQFIIVGGSDHDNIAHGEAFQFIFGTDVFEPFTFDPDSSDGSPPPVWGSGMQSGIDGFDRPTFFGGANEDGLLSPPQTWTVERGTAGRFEWLLRTLSVGSPSPAARVGAFVASDFCGGVTLFGGWMQDTGTVLGDYWQLSGCNSASKLCTWSEFSPVSTARPPARAYAAASQTDGGYPLLFGGADNGGGSAFNDVWVATGGCGGAWTLQATTGDIPPGRQAHTLTYAGSGEGRYLFGGRSELFSGTDYNDVYVLGRASEWEWERITPREDVLHPLPPPTRHHAAAWDRARNRLLVFGGENAETYDPSNALWELRVVE